MGVHLCEGADLSQVDILSVAKCHNLIEGKDQVKTVLWDFTLLQHAAVFWDLEWREENKDKWTREKMLSFGTACSKRCDRKEIHMAVEVINLTSDITICLFLIKNTG